VHGLADLAATEAATFPGYTVQPGTMFRTEAERRAATV
jgi:hypothetical protein